MGDRAWFYQYPRNRYAQGMRAFDADTLTPLWNWSDIQMSSHTPALIDVDGDGNRDSIGLGQQKHGLCVINISTGRPLPGKCLHDLDIVAHSQF